MNAAIKTAISAMAVAVLVSAAGPVRANDDPDFEITLPAGVACAEFDLTVEGWAPKNHVYREWVDENGVLVRSLDAGKGSDLLFINDDTGATYSLKGKGSVYHTTYNSDGSQTTVSTGHIVLIWFPTDVPTGPWTRLYVGQTTFTIDGDGTGHFENNNGREIDICAALSQ